MQGVCSMSGLLRVVCGGRDSVGHFWPWGSQQTPCFFEGVAFKTRLVHAFDLNGHFMLSTSSRKLARPVEGPKQEVHALGVCVVQGSKEEEQKKKKEKEKKQKQKQKCHHHTLCEEFYSGDELGCSLGMHRTWREWKV